MKVSIWQQFSSNHSASYTVIGEFQTPEAARKSAYTILKLLHEIQSQPEVEERIGAKYGFEWQQPLDWLNNRIEPAIKFYDRLVIIDPNYVETWQTGHQFVNLLTALGANTARDVMRGISPDGQDNVWMSLAFEIRADIDDMERVKTLQIELNTIFKGHQASWKTYPTPWMVCHPEFKTLTRRSPAEILQQETVYIEDQKRWAAFVAAQVGQSEKEIGDKYNDFISLGREQWLLISQLKSDTRVFADHVHIDGNQLVIASVTFGDIQNGLPAFLTYLEHAGCKNPRYSVMQL